jgi:hypothetical protein
LEAKKILIEKDVETNFKNRKKKIAATTVLLLMLTLPIAFFALPTVSAHDPPLEIQSYPYLAISPDPVGVGQTVYLVMWIHGAPPTAAGAAGDRWHDFFIDIVDPTGHTQTLGPFTSDPTGSTYTTYTPTQIGTYACTFRYTGQVASLYNPDNGLPGTPSDFVGDTWLPSQVTVNLLVQQEQIPPPEVYPLPTNYWTRPISADNHQWSTIASNWLNSPQLGTGYDLWQTGSGPSSPHILWTKPIEFGGVVGGNLDQVSGETSSYVPDTGFYSGGSYEGRFGNSIIMGGILYYAEPLGHSNVGGGYTAVNLQTGQVLWHRDDLNAYLDVASTNVDSTTPSIGAPTFGQLYDYESPNQHGVVGGLLWQSSSSGGVTTWQAFDAYTGKWAFNETGIPRGTQVYTNKGEIVQYILDYNTTTNTGTLALWNNTQEQMGLHRERGTGTNQWQWRPDGKSVDMSQAYTWNVTLPNLSGNSAPAIVQVLPGDIILGRSSAVAPGVGDKYTPDPFTLWAISDKDSNRGQLIWKQDYPAPSGNLTRRFITSWPIDPVNRVFVMSDVETMQFLGYSLDTGDLLWGPTNIPQRAYTYYGSGEGGGQRGAMAYGYLYVQGFGGELNCINTLDGSLAWKFNNTNSGIDTPWGLRPIFIAAITDGKVYAFNNEHSPNDPLYVGNSIYCIDAYTGQQIYKMLSWSGQTGGRGTSTAVLADGVLCYYNYYDNSIYAVGKGPSATTVDAPMINIAQGQSITIRGTVTDVSAGAKQKVQNGLFNSVPVVSDESQAAWMEYIYMQKPKPTDATGVPVTLTAIDPNGNLQNIGTVNSDSSGNYATMWTPPVSGLYTVTATFSGSNSYWGSSATTSFGVSSAPAASPTSSVSPSVTQAPEPSAGGISTTTYIIIAAVVVIVAVASAAVVLLRRR